MDSLREVIETHQPQLVVVEKCLSTSIRNLHCSAGARRCDMRCRGGKPAGCGIYCAAGEAGGGGHGHAKGSRCRRWQRPLALPGCQVRCRRCAGLCDLLRPLRLSERHPASGTACGTAGCSRHGRFPVAGQSGLTVRLSMKTGRFHI